MPRGVLDTGKTYEDLAMKGFMQQAAEKDKMEQVSLDVEANKKMQRDKMTTQGVGIAANVPGLVKETGILSSSGGAKAAAAAAEAATNASTVGGGAAANIAGEGLATGVAAGAAAAETGVAAASTASAASAAADMAAVTELLPLLML